MFDLIPFEHRNHRYMNPFADLERSFFGDFGDLEKDFPCKTDILDKGDPYLVKADLPGFAKEDIRIDVDGDCLTISAEKKKETKEEKDNFIRRERRYGSLSRSFDISGVDAAAIKAKYDSGVLELTLPKKGDVTPPSHQISIE